MKNNPDMVSFEEFIQQQSDDFRMYPSHRVWHSVYNNMHPGRKWPSISMCIVLLTTLFMVGYLNTRVTRITVAINQPSSNYITTTSSYSGKSFILFLNESFLAIVKLNSTTENLLTQNKVLVPLNYIAKSTSTKDKNSDIAISANISNNSTNTFIDEKLFATSQHHFLNNSLSGSTSPYNNAAVNDEINSYVVNRNQASNILTNTITTANINIASEKNIISKEDNIIETEELSQGLKNRLRNNNDISLISMQIGTAAKNSISEIALTKINIGTPVITLANNTSISSSEKSWIENFALYNKPVAKKWKGRVETQLFITPSIVYRQLHDNAAGKNRSFNSLNSSINNTNINNSVTQSPSLGFEIGFNWLYQLPKGLKLKGGFQLNYTRYTVHAFDNYHPTATSLSMNSSTNDLLYEVFRATPYSNMFGLSAVKLHNQTVQISLPFGVDIKLAGSDNIEWYAGATIQPTYVLAGKSFLLSSDRRNYVKDNSMLNRFNMNAGFETYISFKKDGYTLQVGPQLRTQLFSTNSKIFTFEERLQGYGLKIGISKKL